MLYSLLAFYCYSQLDFTQTPGSSTEPGADFFKAVSLFGRDIHFPYALIRPNNQEAL